MSLLEKINEVAEQYKGEYSNDPGLVPDWLIANKLNEQPTTVEQVYVPIVCKDIKGMLIIGGEYAVIKELSLDGQNPIKALCVNVLEALNGFDTLDMNIPEYLVGYSTIAAQLEAATIITTATKQKLLSLIVQVPKVVYGESWAQLNDTVVNSFIVGITRKPAEAVEEPINEPELPVEEPINEPELPVEEPINEPELPVEEPINEPPAENPDNENN